MMLEILGILHTTDSYKQSAVFLLFYSVKWNLFMITPASRIKTGIAIPLFLGLIFNLQRKVNSQGFHR
jgi:hypothetical protein